MGDIFSTIWLSVVAEFSDVSALEDGVRIVVRLTMAILLGAVVGFERERRGKAAGLRTHMLVSLGAALFVLAPSLAGMQPADISRVIQGVVAGIGFLGAGAIIKMNRDHEIKGLTTAASIWVAAAIGISAGMGREITAVIGTLAALFILSVVKRIESKGSRED